MPGAKNAVETCLGVRPGEHVALIADEASRSVAASIAAAIEDRRAHYTGLLLEDFGPRPMTASRFARSWRSRTRKWNSSAMELYSRSSLFW